MEITENLCAVIPDLFRNLISMLCEVSNFAGYMFFLVSDKEEHNHSKSETLNSVASLR